MPCIFSGSITITDANGCATTVDATVTQPASAVSGTTVVTNVACSGGSTGAIDLTPAGGMAPYTFDWGGGITTEDRTGLPAGTYSVTITDANGCATTVDATVTQSDPVSAPTGAATQTFNAGDTLSALVANGQNIKWYATADNATNHIDDLPLNTLIVNNTTYYATQTIGGCESKTSLAVLAWNEDMGVINTNGKVKIQIYPNPVIEVLHFSGEEKINKIIIMSLDGRKVSERIVNNERKLDVHTLVQGTYLINIFTDKGVQTIKFIKN